MTEYKTIKETFNGRIVPDGDCYMIVRDNGKSLNILPMGNIRLPLDTKLPFGKVTITIEEKLD